MSASSAAPSSNSNGNSFDFQGRQLSCEHLNRRVVRYELDGSATVLADAFQGKKLNSPNDVVAHPDGSYWFTDPPYGGQLYEGAPDARGRTEQSPTARSIRGSASRRASVRRPSANCRPTPTGSTRAGASSSSCRKRRCRTPTACASRPTTRRLYVASDRQRPGRHRAGRQGRGLCPSTVGTDNKVSATRKLFSGFHDRRHQVRTRRACAATSFGNVWVSSNAGRNVGYSGVTVWSPEGKLIGRIRLPEICGNVCFGGPKRNRLFMAASQSLYALYVGVQGAGPG